MPWSLTAAPDSSRGFDWHFSIFIKYQETVNRMLTHWHGFKAQFQPSCRVVSKITISYNHNTLGQQLWANYCKYSSTPSRAWALAWFELGLWHLYSSSPVVVFSARLSLSKMLYTAWELSKCDAKVSLSPPGDRVHQWQQTIMRHIFTIWTSPCFSSGPAVSGEFSILCLQSLPSSPSALVWKPTRSSLTPCCPSFWHCAALSRSTSF